MINVTSKERKARSERMKALLNDPVVQKKRLKAVSKALKRLHKNSEFEKRRKLAAVKGTKKFWSVKKNRDRMSRILGNNGRTCLKRLWKTRRKKMIKVCKRLGRANAPRLRKQWKDPNFVSRYSFRPSKPALKFFYSLQHDGLCDFVLEHAESYYSIDIADSKLKIAIEIDGEYWHEKPSMMKRDKRKDKFLAKRGWAVLRIPVKRLKWIRYWLQEVHRLVDSRGLKNAA